MSLGDICANLRMDEMLKIFIFFEIYVPLSGTSVESEVVLLFVVLLGWIRLLQERISRIQQETGWTLEGV